MVSACSFKNDIDPNHYCKILKLTCIQNNKKVLFITSKGNIEVELFGEDYPVTVSNFIENINNNIYSNQKFYKIINYPHVKFIHGGVNPENKSYIQNNNLDKTSPLIPLEIKLKEEINPRYQNQIINPQETED